jgi:hypothetical protein
MLRKLAASIVVFAAVLTGMVAGGAPGMAGNLPIAAFAGHFSGTGLARNDLSEYFNLTVRDLDVVLTLRDDGFVLTWTTVQREGGDPDNPKVRRKSTTLAFLPTDRESVYRAFGGGDPLSGGRYAWARIREQTLTVHSLVIADDGSYEIHTYDRTLGGTGMDLRFTRVRDGETTRSVTGKLTKVAD